MNTDSSQSAIVATGLHKSYGEKVVLDGIDLDIPKGTIFALLGPNGAGKPTAAGEENLMLMADLHHLGASRGETLAGSQRAALAQRRRFRASYCPGRG